MERLTENLSDFAYTYKGKEKSTIEYDKWVFEATNKLGRIEDLEEEIGLSVEEMALILKALQPKLYYIPNYKEDNEEYIHLWQREGYADDEILEITDKNKDLLNAFKKCFKEY